MIDDSTGSKLARHCAEQLNLDRTSSEFRKFWAWYCDYRKRRDIKVKRHYSVDHYDQRTNKQLFRPLVQDCLKAFPKTSGSIEQRRTAALKTLKEAT